MSATASTCLEQSLLLTGVSFVLLAIVSAADLIWSSSWIILLFLIVSVSFSLFMSASCCIILLLHELRAVLRNSSSGFSVITLLDLCLAFVFGNLTGAVLVLGSFGKVDPDTSNILEVVCSII